MRFRKIVVDKLDKIMAVASVGANAGQGKNDIIQILKDENKELRKQLDSVLNRLMSRNFEEHQLMTMGTGLDEPLPFNPLEDEGLIGETVDMPIEE